MRFSECFTIDRHARGGGEPLSPWGLALRLLLNSGYRAVVYYRLACYLKGVTFPRRTTNFLALMVLARLARVPGVEIHPGAEIGRGLHIPHPHDIVVGFGARLGERVTLFNGVTLGARDLLARDDAKDSRERYPTLEDDVTVFTGAKILGPVRIGRNSVVGANSVVLHSFPENSVLVGAPARNIAESANAKSAE